MTRSLHLRAPLLWPLLLCAGHAWAQGQPPTAEGAPGTPPAPAPQPAAAPPNPPAAPGSQRVEITGGRTSDTEERRRSTAAKIVIGREEIDKFGDATVGEVLRRLPGVTTPGAPGRGGPPRMRGLGNGYTQLLIDGQRIPPGFSLESLTPEQIERIEILRAPTAETGARAIAGTINIITREGFTRRLNDVRLGFGYENHQFSPGVSWTHNNSAGPLIYNLSVSGFQSRRKSSSQTEVIDEELASGRLLNDQIERSRSEDHRRGLNLTSRLQWRLNEQGDMLVLMPMVVHTQSGTARTFALEQVAGSALPALGNIAPLYEFGDAGSDSQFTLGRLNLSWRQRTPIGRLELNGGSGLWRSMNDGHRDEFRTAAGSAPVRSTTDSSRARQVSFNLNTKLSSLVGGQPEGGGEHSLVTGLELDGQRRNESRTLLQGFNGGPLAPLLTDFGDNLEASSLRTAAFAQDEWSITPNWAAHAGLRWEGISTRGSAALNQARPENRSSVWTPLLHAVWKPDPKGRDQIRVSLTRSYRSPDLGTLIARPSINGRYPATGANTPTAPDRAGNPALQPELARGLDLAAERYLEGGGLLSANVFARRIHNLMRSVTALETVSWSPVPRWVARQQNIGDATTQGIELEAKFRLDQLVPDAPRIELRSNVSFYRSRVDGVPGPDNRLDSQAKATGNLGGDYRLRSIPLTLGGNVNWVPGYRTRLAEDQVTTVSTKRVWDAFALWTFSPAVGLRLLGNNLTPATYLATNTLTTEGLRETSATRSTTYTNWQLRLELKL